MFVSESKSTKEVVRREKAHKPSPSKLSKTAPEVPLSGNEIPVVKWKRPVVISDEESSESISEQHIVRQSENMPPSNGDIPVVKWKRPALPLEEDTSPESVLADPAGEQKSGGQAEHIPVVKWKKPVVPSDDSITDEPVTRRKARLPPSEEPANDVPVVKWKRPVVPSDEESIPDEPVTRRKARLPPSEEPANDVPVVKWKRPVVPSDEESIPDEPVTRRKARLPPSEEPANDVPVVKWKRPVVPSEKQEVESVPVVKWKVQESSKSTSQNKHRVADLKARSPPELVARKSSSPESLDSQKSGRRIRTANQNMRSMQDRKARSPADLHARNSSSPESLDLRNTKGKKSSLPSGQRRLVKKEVLKAPTDSNRKSLSPENSGMSAQSYKARLPAGSREQHEKPSLKMGMPPKRGGSRVSPQQQNGRAVQSSPSNSYASSSLPKPEEIQSTSSRRSKAREAVLNSPGNASVPDILRSSRSKQQKSNGSLSPELISQEISRKPSSRRSSFSDSRSPSPPSIAPHIMKVAGSPMMRRRTPSPARAAANKPSPNQSPALQQKQQLKLLTNQALSGPHLTPNLGSKLRTPHTGLAKGGTPVKGLIAPGDKKRRLLPLSPDSASRMSPGVKSQAASAARYVLS